MNRSTIILTVAAAFISFAATAEPRIERLAPQDSVFIIGLSDVSAAADHAKATPLWSLWQSPELAELRTQVTKDYHEGMKEMFEELGFEGETLPMPTGAVGFAVFPVLDPELAVNQPGFLMFADYGANIEQASSLADAMIRKGREEGDVVVDEEQVLGRTVYTFERKDQEQPADGGPGADEPVDGDPMNDEEDMQDMEGMEDFQGGGPQAMLESIDTMYYVRDGSVLMLTSDLESLTETLESPDGRKTAAVADSPAYQGVMTRLGETDAYAVLLLDNVAKVLDAEQNMEMAMIWPMVKSVIGDVAGVGVGLRLDAPNAMLESTWSVHMPNGMSGLAKLMDTAVARGPLPAFVGSDAFSYSHMHIDFDRLMATLREIVGSNPMMAQMGGDQMLADIEPIVQKLAAGLGSDLHSVSTVTQPVTHESLKSFFAITCDDPAALNDFLAVDLMMPARDFLGHRIYSIDPNLLAAMPVPGIPDSVGVGGGHVVIGPASAVEQALRADNAAGGGARLIADPMMKSALAAIPEGPAVGWGFTDIIMQMEAMKVMTEHTQQVMMEQWREHDPEGAAEMEKEIAPDEDNLWAKFDPDLLSRYIGPMAWWTGVNDTGFTAKGYLLAPVK